MPKRMSFRVSTPRKSYMARMIKDKNKRVTKKSGVSIDKRKVQK